MRHHIQLVLRIFLRFLFRTVSLCFEGTRHLTWCESHFDQLIARIEHNTPWLAQIFQNLQLVNDLHQSFVADAGSAFVTEARADNFHRFVDISIADPQRAQRVDRFRLLSERRG